MHAAKSAKVAAFRATVLPEVRRLIGGMPQRKIAAELNRRGLRTHAGRPWRCSMSTACWPPGAGLRHDPVITSCGLFTERDEPGRIGGVRRHVPIVVGGTVGPPDRAALAQRPLRRIDAGPCRGERDRVALGGAHGSPGG